MAERGIPLAFLLTSDIREYAAFVYAVNRIRDHEGVSAEEAIDRMKAGKSATEVSVIEARIALFKSWGLYNPASGISFPTKSEFDREITAVRNKAAEDLGEKRVNLDEKHRDYAKNRSKYNKAVSKSFFGTIGKWGAKVLRVVAIATACLGAPGILGVVASAIGGAVTIGSALGVAILSGGLLYGAYVGVRWALNKLEEWGVKTAAEGQGLLDGDGSNEHPGLRKIHKRTKAAWKEARSEFEAISETYASLDELYCAMDAMDATREEARDFGAARMEMARESDVVAYKAAVDKYHYLVDYAQTNGDIEAAKALLEQEVDRMPTIDEMKDIDERINSQQTHIETCRDQYFDPEFRKIESECSKKIEQCEQIKNNFSRQNYRSLPANIIAPEEYQSKAGFENVTAQQVEAVLEGYDEIDKKYVQKQIMEEFANPKRHEVHDLDSSANRARNLANIHKSRNPLVNESLAEEVEMPRLSDARVENIVDAAVGTNSIKNKKSILGSCRGLVNAGRVDKAVEVVMKKVEGASKAERAQIAAKLKEGFNAELSAKRQAAEEARRAAASAEESSEAEKAETTPAEDVKPATKVETLVTKTEKPATKTEKPAESTKKNKTYQNPATTYYKKVESVLDQFKSSGNLVHDASLEESYQLAAKGDAHGAVEAILGQLKNNVNEKTKTQIAKKLLNVAANAQVKVEKLDESEDAAEVAKEEITEKESREAELKAEAEKIKKPKIEPLTEWDEYEQESGE